MNDREHPLHFGPATCFTRGSTLNDVIALVEGCQQDGVQIDRPAPVVGFLHPDPLIGERVREVHNPLAEAKGVSGDDGFLQEVPRVVRRREARSISPQ